MCRVVHGSQVLEVQMRVDLRAADAGVAEQLLHGAEIAARLQQMAGETVSQHVRMHMHAEAERLRARAQPAGDAAGAEAVTVASHEQRALARRGEAGA